MGNQTSEHKKTVGEYITKGRDYEKNGALVSALNCYLSALSLDPEHKFALYRVGVIYYELENYESAIYYLEKSIRLSPNQVDAYSYLWNCYGKLGNYKKAVEVVNKALNVNPNYKKAKQMKTEMANKLNESYLKKGLEYFKNNEYNDAISYFKKYLSIMPDCGKCYYYIGECYFALKKYSDAISNYNRCIELCPKEYSNTILKRIGLCYFNLNDFKNAIQKLSLIENQDAESYYYIGMSYLKLGDSSNAESIFKKMSSNKSNLNGSIGSYCYKIGKEYYSLKKYDKALEYLNRSTDLNPKSAGFWHLKGKVYYEIGKYADAKKCFDIVLKKDKNNTGALNHLEKINEELSKTSYKKHSKSDYKSNNKSNKCSLVSYPENKAKTTTTTKSNTITQSNRSSHNNYKRRDDYKPTHYKRLNKHDSYESIINKKCGNSIINALKIFLSKIRLINKNFAKAMVLERKVKEYYNKGDIKSMIDTYEKIIDLLPNKKSDDYKLINAKYMYFMGIYNLMNRHYDTAISNIETAANIFSELKLIDCMLMSINSQTIAMKSLDEDKIIEYIGWIKLRYQLEDIPNIKRYEAYYNIEITYHKYKSKLYRKKKSFNSAKVWAEKERELAEEAYNKFKNNDFKRSMLHATRMYWNLLAKYNESLKLYFDAYKCYMESGDIAKEMENLNTAYDEYAKAYRCLALANFKDKNKFIEYADKSIEYALKSKNDKVINYIYGFKYENLAANIHCDTLDEAIGNLKNAYEYYKKSDEHSAAVVKVKYHFLNAKLNWTKQKYEEALSEINKAQQIYKEYSVKKRFLLAKISNDKLLYEFYVLLKKGDIGNSINKLRDYLDTFNEDGKQSKKYKFFNTLYNGMILLTKSNYDYETISKIDKLKMEANDNDLNDLYKILNSISSKITLALDNIRDTSVEKQQMSAIVSRILRDKVFTTPDLMFSKDDIDRYDDEGDYEYMDKLPIMFISLLNKWDTKIKKYDKYDPDVAKIIIKEYYTILEEYLKIIVEFNAKVLWGDNWKKNLGPLKYRNGNISKMSLQELIDSLHVLKKKNSPYVKDIPAGLKTLLEKQRGIRNDVSHFSVSIKLLNANVKQEIMYIIETLSSAFPDCILVEGRTDNGYKCILCTGINAKSIIVKTNKSLTVGKYYYTKIEGKLKGGILNNPKYLYEMVYNVSHPLEKPVN